LKARLILSNVLFLLLFTNCTEELIRKEIPNSLYPVKLVRSDSFPIYIEQFSPQKIAVDIKGNIFVLGNGSRLVIIKKAGKSEEIALEAIKPCELVDIATDGFDIFLLDRMNRKIWTVSRGKVLSKGFPLKQRPVLFDVSDKGLFSLIYSNYSEISVFSKTETGLSSFHLDGASINGGESTLLIKEHVVYFAMPGNDMIEKLFLYNPSRRAYLHVDSPISLDLDRWNNLFVQSRQGIFCFKQREKEEKVFLSEEKGSDISVYNQRMFILKPEKKSVDVFEIIYSSPGSNHGTGE